MIKIENIEKSYGKNKVLKGVNLELAKGKISVLSGPNGSGKSTLMKLILGIVHKDCGNILVNGVNIQNDNMYRKLIGYMPQQAQFPDNLTSEEIIRICKDLKGAETIKDELIEKFDFRVHIKKLFKHLSGGNMQKLNILQALMFDPEIVILDEPTVSLDPISRITFKEQLRELRERGKTIIVVTHIISEIIDIADDFIYLIDGRILVNDSIHKICNGSGTRNFENVLIDIVKDYERNI